MEKQSLKRREKVSCETDLKRLEEITELLKDESTGLEKAIELYEEASKLTKSLNKTLSSLERRIEKVTSEDEFELEKEEMKEDDEDL